MPAFPSNDLTDRIVAVDRCDEPFGAGIAAALARLGARVRLRGKDREALAVLQSKMAERWLRADIDAAEPAAAEVAVRIFGSAGDAVDFVRSSAPHREILLITGDAPQSDYAALQQALCDHRDGQVHAMLLNEADDTFGALAALLLSPMGATIPNQCFAPSAHKADVPAAAQAYPAMPVCMPTLA